MTKTRGTLRFPLVFLLHGVSSVVGRASQCSGGYPLIMPTSSPSALEGVLILVVVVADDGGGGGYEQEL